MLIVIVGVLQRLSKLEKIIDDKASANRARLGRLIRGDSKLPTMRLKRTES